VIVVSSEMCEFVMLHELIYNYSVACRFLPKFDIFLFSTQSVVCVIAHYAVSVMDAWAITIRGKMCILFPFILSNMMFFWQRRFASWSARHTCMNTECTIMQNLYLSSLQNQITFEMKLLLPYIQGQSFAVMNFRATDHERELFKRQSERQRSSQLSQQPQTSVWSADRGSFHSSTASGNGHDSKRRPGESVSSCPNKRNSTQLPVEEYLYAPARRLKPT